jgi:hypothetical protein
VSRPEPSLLSLMVTTDREREMPLAKERQARSLAPCFEPMGRWESSAAKLAKRWAKERQVPRPEPSLLSLMVRLASQLSAQLESMEAMVPTRWGPAATD